MSEFFSWDLIDLTKVRKTSGEVTTTCPVCSHTRKKKNDKCLGVNLTEGVAHCNHCNAKSVRSFEEKTYEPKIYVMPKWENITELPDNVVKWFERSWDISKDTERKQN